MVDKIDKTLVWNDDDDKGLKTLITALMAISQIMKRRVIDLLSKNGKVKISDVINSLENTWDRSDDSSNEKSTSPIKENMVIESLTPTKENHDLHNSFSEESDSIIISNSESEESDSIVVSLF